MIDYSLNKVNMKFGPDIKLIYWDIGCQKEKKIGSLCENFDVLNDVINNQMTLKWHINDSNGYETFIFFVKFWTLNIFPMKSWICL